MKNKCAVILCGGKGTRLGALSKKIPKTLVKIQKKEILWYIIKFLGLSGFRHIILPLGYKGEQIKKFLKKNKFDDLNIETHDTGVSTNIGSRLYKIAHKIKYENFLLLNGDAVFNFDLKSIYNKHCKENSAITFLSGEITYPFGTIGVSNEKVIDFSRNLVFDRLKIRGARINYQAYNYTGISIIKTDLLKRYKRSFLKANNFEQKFYPIIIKKYQTNLLKISGFWHSIDNLKDIEIVDKKNKKNKKYLDLKKLNLFLKKSKNKTFK